MKRLLPLAAAAVIAITVAWAPVASAALATPTASISAVSKASVIFDIEAGATGAPGGFAVEWMTQEDFDAYQGWPAEGEYAPELYACDFTGAATLNINGDGTFALQVGEAIEIQMGDIFDETGLTANYWDELQPGHTYVFRVRSIASGPDDESPWTQTLTATTLTQESTDCTFTQGYWKNHTEVWPVGSITLGTVVYNAAQLQKIFSTPAQGNGLISLAHQLIAAKLNIAYGATPTAAVSQAIADADALIGGLVVPTVGTDELEPGDTSALTEILDQFNNGIIGPGHCGSTATKPATWGTLKSLYR